MSGQILIWGAGAIGGTIGAFLSRSGQDVTLVDLDADHVRAINKTGLRIEGPVDEFTAGAPAFLPSDLAGRFPLILLAVKANDTEAAVRMLKPFLADDGCVVSCQNGLNEATISAIVGQRRTIGAFVNFGADYQAPGRIMFGNRGAVSVGELNGDVGTDRIKAIRDVFRDFEPDTILSDNIMGFLWGKLGYGSLLKASALTSRGIANFIEEPNFRALHMALVKEFMDLAHAQGIEPLGFNGFEPDAFRCGTDQAALARSFAEMVAYNRESTKYHSGIWRDIVVRRRKSDAIAQLTPVVQIAEQCGQKIPLIHRLIELLSDVEDGRRYPGDDVVEDFMKSVPAAVTLGDEDEDSNGKTNSDPWTWPEEKWRGIVERVRAGQSLKPSAWKGGARVAVGLSFDSDHETSTLRWGETSPGKLSQGEYAARASIPRIRKLLSDNDIRASFFVPAVVARLYPGEQRALVDEGHEIGIHGWIHERNTQLSYEVERDLQMRSADTLEDVTGRRPVGIRTPSWDFSPHTLSIIREMELLYDSSLMADDDPYELVEDREATGVVELPVEWVKDDAVYFNMDRFSALRPYTPPSAVYDIFRSEFEGARNDGGLFILTMHPHHIGHRSRLAVLADLIAYMKSFDDVWFATHEEIARYCLETTG